MLFDISFLQINHWMGQFIWPFFRITAFFMAAPVFGTQLVPARIRLVLAVVVTVLVMPSIGELPPFQGLSAQNLATVAQQVLIGLSMGFFLQLVFHIFVLAGQVIAMQMGLGFASMNDPANGVTVTVLSQFYLMLVILMFVDMGGHLVALQAVIESFSVMPVAETGLVSEKFWLIVQSGAWMFASGLLIALPAVTALLIVNIAFGVMTRAAPQLNIFSLGFPLTLLFGLFVIYISLSGFHSQFVLISNQGFELLGQLYNP